MTVYQTSSDHRFADHSSHLSHYSAGNLLQDGAVVTDRRSDEQLEDVDVGYLGQSHFEIVRLKNSCFVVGSRLGVVSSGDVPAVDDLAVLALHFLKDWPVFRETTLILAEND